MKALKLEGLTREQFDLAIACAEARGFKRDTLYAQWGEKARWNYLSTYKEGLLMFTNNITNKVEVTLEEWCFEGAPDWAVCVFKMDDGYYVFGDGKKRTLRIGHHIYNGKHEHSLEIGNPTFVNAIITREPVEDPWTPKVGDEVFIAQINTLAGVREQRYYIKEYWCDSIFQIELKECGLLFSTKEDAEIKCKSLIGWKPPEPTEEEKAVDDIYEQSLHYSGFIECRITKDAAKALIKAGYRKVEPISYSEVRGLDPESLLSLLESTGRIIVKEGE